MDTSPTMVTLHGGPAIALREEVAMADLPAFFGRAFSQLAACAGDRVAGPPFARYHAVERDRVDVEAAMPVTAPVAVTAPIAAVQLCGGPAVQIEHVGPYEDLAATYGTLERWIADHHQQRADAVREVYLNSPAEVPDPSGLVTLVIQPLQSAPGT